MDGAETTMLDRWKERGVISPEQHALLSRLSRGEPFSVFYELNFLLYAGVVAFAAGLAWTVQSYSRQLGDMVVVTALLAILGACLWYCFSRAPAWSASQTTSPSLVFDYVLYLASLTWLTELAYAESRLHILSGQWDSYLLATAFLFFALAYRFDNRLVLSLALSALAGWFGIRLQRWPGASEGSYRELAIGYSLLTGAVGVALKRLGIKAHFLAAFLNVAANVLFMAVLSGVFNREGYLPWFLFLLALCGASLAYGLSRKQFSFVAYAAVYGYVGASSVLIRGINDGAAMMVYFVVTGIGMLAALAGIARRSGRAL